jgi:hypothetical protein
MGSIVYHAELAKASDFQVVAKERKEGEDMVFKNITHKTHHGSAEFKFKGELLETFEQYGNYYCVVKVDDATQRAFEGFNPSPVGNVKAYRLVNNGNIKIKLSKKNSFTFAKPESLTVENFHDWFKQNQTLYFNIRLGVYESYNGSDLERIGLFGVLTKIELPA